MSNNKANATYHGRTERPSFPEDALTASERKALRTLDDEAKHREGWKSAPTEWTPVPARNVTPSPFDDGQPVKATWGNLLAMLSGAAVIVAVLGGLYLEFAALAH